MVTVTVRIGRKDTLYLPRDARDVMSAIGPGPEVATLPLGKIYFDSGEGERQAGVA